MGILVYRDQKTAAAAVTTLIAAQIIEKPNSTLCFAAGKNMEGIYSQLAAMTGSGVIDWSDVQVFDPCEFSYDPPFDNMRFGAYLTKKLYDKVNISASNIHSLRIEPAHINEICEAYENEIMDQGGIDLQVVSLGINGELAGNIEAPFFETITHPAPMTKELIGELGNDLWVGAQIPNEIVTMGTGTIMASKKLIVTAFGSEKANAVQKLINGTVTPKFPASILQVHQNVMFIFDESAAAKL